MLLKIKLSLLSVMVFGLAAVGHSATLTIAEGFNTTGILPLTDMVLGSVALFDSTPAFTDLLIFVPVTDSGGIRTGTGYAFCSVDNLDPATVPICSAAPTPYDVYVPLSTTPTSVAPGILALVTSYSPILGQPGSAPSLEPSQPTYILVTNPSSVPEPAIAYLLVPAMLGFVLRRSWLARHPD